MTSFIYISTTRKENSKLYSVCMIELYTIGRLLKSVPMCLYTITIQIMIVVMIRWTNTHTWKKDSIVSRLLPNKIFKWCYEVTCKAFKTMCK